MSHYGTADDSHLEDTHTYSFEVQHDSIAKRTIPIPSALPVLHVNSTPLPAVPLIVLSISVMSEFLCANVSMPFLFSMVRGFSPLDDEVVIGSWTGILVSVFFLAQFATSLLWASLADSFGRGTVLLVSLLGSTVTCILFSVQSSFASTVVVRIVQGVFAGAVGVARSSVTHITDSSNEGRAYAIMGFAWGLGGVVGAIIGGSFESPSEKWPALFGHIALLKLNPYLLPCTMAAGVTFAGATMSLLLDRNGLPRQWSLLPKSQHDAEQSITRPLSSLQPTIGFPRMNSYTSYVSQTSFLPYRSVPVVAFAQPVFPVSENPHVKLRATETGIRGYPATRSQADSASEDLVERIITANQNQATSLPELWVAAAIGTDIMYDDLSVEPYSTGQDNISDRVPTSLAMRSSERLPLLRYNSVSSISGQPIVTSQTSLRMYRTLTMSSLAISNGSIARRAPSIFANTGVRDRTGLDALDTSESVIGEDGTSTISDLQAKGGHMRALHQVPILFILQYGLLALHTTTHDQVFYSYFMTRFEAGGLGLDPSQFSQLIAAMSVLQLFYQFYVYPTLGPPRGLLSHLTMFRLGCLLFIPSYFTVVFYRGYQHPSLMLVLIASTAVRFCATTFSFTSATILLNFLTPTPYFDLANGLAQSMASLARFVGPALGAKIWAVSVATDPEGYAFGFWVCTAVCTFSLLVSYSVR